MNYDDLKYSSLVDCLIANNIPRGKNASFFFVKFTLYLEFFLHDFAFDSDLAFPIDKLTSLPQFQTNLTYGYIVSRIIRITSDYRIYLHLNYVIGTLIIEIIITSILGAIMICSSTFYLFFGIFLAIFSLINLRLLILSFISKMKYKNYLHKLKKEIIYSNEKI
ncbi:hypothetical protein WKT22_02437 [Candidatus Lokiarchaeum ossiferum]